MFVSHDKSKKKRLQKPNILRRNPKTFKSINKSHEFNREKSMDTCHFLETDPKNELKKSCIMKTSNEVSDVKLENLNVSQAEPKQTCLFPLLSDVTDMVVIQPSLNIDSFLIRHSEEQSIPLLKSKHSTDSTVDKVCLAFIDDSNPLIVGNCRSLKEIYASDKNNINSIIPQAIFSGRTESMHSANDCATIDSITHSRTKYKCDVGDCEKVFLSEQKLLKHKNTHKLCRVARQSVFECPVKNSCKVKANCKKVFVVKEELVKHINEDHTVDDAAYKCDECERCFFWASGLRAHKRSHVERASFACPWPECGRVFRHACRLREHSRAHTGAKPYHCTYPNCDWSFRTASKLLRHSRRHTGDRRHTCSQCGRAFLRREHLRDHEARHHALETASNTNNDTSDVNLKQHNVMRNTDKSMKKVKNKKRRASAQNTCYGNEIEPGRCLKKPGPKFTVQVWEGNQTVNSFDEKPEPAVRDITNDLITRVEPKSEEVKDFFLATESFEEAADLTPIPEEGKNFVITHGDREYLITSGVGGEGSFVIANAEDFVIQAREEAEDVAITSHFDGDRDFAMTSGPDERDLLVRGQEGSDGHAARTHCTWPLPHKAEYNSPDDYVLEDDVQVEHLEGAESNVFTVRSDLFLHGSVFHSEDSEQMCSTARASASERALDSELTLDAPSVHLAQEELYTDAVDESSFRVFLLSGEELA